MQREPWAKAWLDITSIIRTSGEPKGKKSRAWTCIRPSRLAHTMTGRGWLTVLSPVMTSKWAYYQLQRHRDGGE